MDIKKNLSTQNNKSIVIQHGGNICQEAKRLGLNTNELIDASASIVPFEHPNEIHDCINQAIKGIEIRSYPDLHYSELKKSIGQWHSIDPSMVLPGNGAAELLTWAARDASHSGISALPSPGFSDYKRALHCWNGSYLEVPLPLSWKSNFPQKFPLDLKSKVVWITNPHNPTGQLWSRKSLEVLLKTNDLVICDEAFLPLVPKGEQQSLIPLVKNYKNLIVIRSLTKIFAIAGLRLGYAISQPKRLKQWQILRDPWPVNGIALSVGLMLMSNQSVMVRQIKKVENWVINEGKWLNYHLSTLPGIIAHPSSTNFQLIESRQPLTSLREKLAQKGILLRDCRSFKGLGETWLRISLQTKEDNQLIITKMRESL